MFINRSVLPHDFTGKELYTGLVYICAKMPLNWAIYLLLTGYTLDEIIYK